MRGFRPVYLACVMALAASACSPTPDPNEQAGGGRDSSTGGDANSAELVVEDNTAARMVTSEAASPTNPEELAFDIDADGDGDGDDVGDGPDRLRLALIRPDSYSPVRIDLADNSATLVLDLLYDGLTTFDVDRGAVGPGLARRWQSDGDFDRWEFELDRSREVGIDDVVRTFADLSAADDALVALTADNINAVTGDDERIVIELDRPDPDFPAAISGVAFSIVGVSGNGLGGRSTGRFTVISDDANGMVLRSDDGGRVDPATGVSEIVITWVDDIDDGYDQLTLGFVDAAVVDGRQMGDARSRFAETFPVVNTTRFIVVNPRSSALATKSARTALAAALDVDDLVANGAQSGSWTRRNSLRPGPYGGADDHDGGIEPCASAKGCTLSESPDDSTLSSVRRTVTVGFSDEMGEELAWRVATDLRAAGWVVDLAPVPAGLQAGASDSDVDLVVVDQTWPWPTGSHALAAISGPGRLLSNVDVDGQPAADVITRALQVDSPVERAAATAFLEDKLVDSSWVVPLAGRRSMLARSPVVQHLGLTFEGSPKLDQ